MSNRGSPTFKPDPRQSPGSHLPGENSPHDSRGVVTQFINSPQAIETDDTARHQLAATFSGRPYVRGKFIWADNAKLYLRGVTYGTFRPNAAGEEFHDRARVEADLEQIAAAGCNAIRTYTPPPLWMLDAAQRHGLRVMVGLPWEQHVDFLADHATADRIESEIRTKVRNFGGHSAILCFALGNEIPAPVVRWLGPNRVERFLRRLNDAVKDEDPGALTTYVNYPSTEYLRDPCDLVCFNVYLESQPGLEAYLARLQNIAGDRPLVMAEIGLDSRSNGASTQAQALDWQVRTTFSSGCAGAFVFAWTDEWYRGGHDIEDWDFGLTDRDRQPKPALSAVRDAFVDVPLPWSIPWPMFSVVICSYNGARTIAASLRSLRELHYEQFETIVIDDGSTDGTADIARQFDVQVISTPNRGLSSARNEGLKASTGEVVVYLDDDAHPDPHWLTYLAAMFRHTDHAAIGGPNLPPLGDGLVAECVAAAPGGPIHVLYTDTEAEHIPGCNMAIRKSALEAIGGFDPQFRVAGDDVDVCWRLQKRGWTLGFSPAAMVWHHRRNSIGAYWKQQRGYGRAEAMLEQKWPEKYNSAGHVTWGGRLYGAGIARRLITGRGRIRFGQWGTGLFQSLYEPSPGKLRSLPLMPEWYLLIATLAAITTLGVLWRPLLWTWVPLLIAGGLLVGDAGIAAAEADFSPRLSPGDRRKRSLLTFLLHLLQPLARLRGRLTEGLSPWRRRGPGGLKFTRTETILIWSEQWKSAEDRLLVLESSLRESGALVHRGGDFDTWDLEALGGTLGGVRLLMGIEEHGNGRQMVRVRIWPRISALFSVTLIVFAGLATMAAQADANLAAVVLGGSALLVGLRGLHQCSTAQTAAWQGLEAREGEHQVHPR